MPWVYQPQQLRDTLEAAGFDVDTSAAALEGGGSLSARQQRGERATVVSLDAGGRFLATLTALVDTSPPKTVDIEGVQLRVVPELTRTTTVSGQLAAPDQLKPLLDALPSLADSHTGRTKSDKTPPAPATPDGLASVPIAPAHAPRTRTGRPWWRSWR